MKIILSNIHFLSHLCFPFIAIVMTLTMEPTHFANVLSENVTSNCSALTLNYGSHFLVVVLTGVLTGGWVWSYSCSCAHMLFSSCFYFFMVVVLAHT